MSTEIHPRASIQAMRKVELHAHLNGSLDAGAIKELIALKGDDYNVDVAQLAILRDGPVTLDKAFQLFPLVQDLVDSPASVRHATLCALRSMHADGVVYVELRSTPKRNARMTKTQYILAVLDACDEMKDDIMCKLLISIDRRRGVEDAQDSLNVVQKLLQDGHRPNIVGFDLSGPPNICGLPFKSILEIVKSMGFKLSLHLAERSDSLTELAELIPLADRIGHGTFLDKDQNARRWVVDRKIPIEICLTSNILGSTVSSFASHHVKDWWLAKHPIAICTDDFGIFNTTLSKEYEIFASTFNVDDEAMKSMVRQCMRSAFASDEEIEHIFMTKL